MQWTGKAKLVVIKNNYIKTLCSVPGQLNYYKLKKQIYLILFKTKIIKINNYCFE